MSKRQSWFDSGTDTIVDHPGSEAAQLLEDDLWAAIRKTTDASPEETEQLVETCQILIAGQVNGFAKDGDGS